MHAVVVDGVVRASDVESGPGEPEASKPRRPKLWQTVPDYKNAGILLITIVPATRMPPIEVATGRRPPPLVLEDNSTDSAECTDPMENWQDAQGSPALFPSQTTPVVPMQPAKPREDDLVLVPETPPGVLEAARCKRTVSEAATNTGTGVLDQREAELRKAEDVAVKLHNAVVAAVDSYEEAERQFRENLEADVKAKLSAAAEELRAKGDGEFRKKLARLTELEQTRVKSLREEYEEAVRRLGEKYTADSERAAKAHKDAIRQLQDAEEAEFVRQYNALKAKLDAEAEARVRRIGKKAKVARAERV